MIVMDLLLWGLGLGLANQAWDTFAAARRMPVGGASRPRATRERALPALLCWMILLQSVTFRLEEQARNRRFAASGSQLAARSGQIRRRA
jgi:hypothetical protein